MRYTLNTVCYQQGYTFLTKEQLVNSAHLLLQSNPIISLEDLGLALEDLVNNSFIVKEEDRYFDSALHKSEVKCAERIKKLKNKKVSLHKVEDIIEAIKEVELDLDIHYTDLQKEAIVKALSNKLTIITGGPGTGKSTIINGIIRCYAKLEDLVFPSETIIFFSLNVFGTITNLFECFSVPLHPHSSQLKKRHEGTFFEYFSFI